MHGFIDSSTKVSDETTKAPGVHTAAPGAVVTTRPTASGGESILGQEQRDQHQHDHGTEYEVSSDLAVHFTDSVAAVAAVAELSDGRGNKPSSFVFIDSSLLTSTFLLGVVPLLGTYRAHASTKSLRL